MLEGNRSVSIGNTWTQRSSTDWKFTRSSTGKFRCRMMIYAFEKVLTVHFRFVISRWCFQNFVAVNFQRQMHGSDDCCWCYHCCASSIHIVSNRSTFKEPSAIRPWKRCFVICTKIKTLQLNTCTMFIWLFVPMSNTMRQIQVNMQFIYIYQIFNYKTHKIVSNIRVIAKKI